MPETLETPSKSLALRPRPANGVEIALPRSQTVPLPAHIIAASEEMREIVSVVRAIAPTAITVLLIGESGTGKEVFAELIHDLSERKGPFVTVNCG
ncbi:MAG: sigma 54-interacting transcriptional regulator, partial [Candidatus Kapaibacterium sp.]